jgi:type IV secretory pathway TrbD component
VHLQVRIVAAMLLLAALSIGTGTVLLLGYLLAAFSIGVIIFILARKMIRRIADAHPALRLLLRSPADIL